MKMDDLVETYIRIREKKSQLRAEYEAKVAKYDDAQDKIEALLLRRFGELGIDSIKTAAGTAYTTTRSAATIADWDAYREFLERQEDPFIFLEHRASKTAIEQYKAANEDIPPGVSWSETRVVNFRRGS